VYRDLQCATSGNANCPPAAPPHGVCAGTGAYQCTSNGQDTECTAPYNGSAAGEEICDGLDNDCDTLVDETFNNKGSNATFFVRPNVVRIGSSPNLWVYQYEASRPRSGPTDAGNGNGYWCSGSGCSSGLFNGANVPNAPAGVQLNRTPACSEPNRVPWSNVTPIEVEQTCTAMGGFICDLSEWQVACEAQANCGWGYAPTGNCSSPANYTNRFCNLHEYDFDGMDGQDGILPTGSTLLMNCNADWRNTTGNSAGSDRIYDITGNLREITRSTSTIYTLMGGAYNSHVEAGARCDFDFYSVANDFKLYDTGFRCCFSSNPRN
jgi:hypothetical protein